jgi:hypothetical protein
MGGEAKIEFCVSVGLGDWNESQGGWRCEALQLPGASVTAV